MSGQHTSGPWAVSDRAGADGAVSHSGGYIAFPCAPRKVCEDRNEGESWMAMRDRTQSARDAITKEQAANAQLIAAAPELLEALNMVKEAAIDMRGEDFNLTTGQWLKVHAAIAKASPTTTDAGVAG